MNASLLGKPSPGCVLCFFRRGGGVGRGLEAASLIQTGLNSLCLRTSGDAPSYKAENPRSCSFEKVRLLAFRFRHCQKDWRSKEKAYHHCPLIKTLPSEPDRCAQDPLRCVYRLDQKFGSQFILAVVVQIEGNSWKPLRTNAHPHNHTPKKEGDCDCGGCCPQGKAEHSKRGFPWACVTSA